ncbi:hypothetical protein IAT38_000170 [Cryptococcus sp. DSM 104549]
MLASLAGYALAALALLGSAPTLAIKITWPNDTKQCDEIAISWTKGTKPYTFWLLPTPGMPVRWILDEDVLNTTLPMQLSSGTNYIVVGTDLTDDFKFLSYSSSEINTVLPSSNSSCLGLQFSAEYSFHVSGTANQCSSGFLITWLDTANVGPYYFTVFPLDQSFRPFDVDLGNKTTGTYDWTVNLPEGTRFSIGMGSKNGHYRSGVGGIYEVGPGSSSSCVNIAVEPTGAWPSGIPTNQLSPATSAYGSSVGSTASATASASTIASPSSTAGNDSSESSNTPVGAIVGGIVGGAAIIALAAFGIFFLLRRRRAPDEKHIKIVDLSDHPYPHGGSDGNPSPTTAEAYHPIVPFPSTIASSSRVPTLGHHGRGAMPPGYAASTIAGGSELDGSGAWVTGEYSTSAGASSRSRSRGGCDMPQSVGSEASHSYAGTFGPSSPPPESPRSSVHHNLPPQTSLDTKHPPAGGLRLATAHEEDESLRSGAGSPEEAGGAAFWRHEDAGRVGGREVVELPPLYTRVPSEVGSERTLGRGRGDECR